MFLVLANVGSSLQWEDKKWGSFAGFHPDLDEAGMPKWEFILVTSNGLSGLKSGMINPRRFGLVTKLD